MTTIKLKGDHKTRKVWMDGKELDPKPSQEMRNHSPDGFNWGYGGSGPAQLALAIMLGCPLPFGFNYQQFKWDHIATLPQGSFDTEITFDENKYL